MTADSPLHSPLRTELAATVRLAVPLAAANLLQMAVYAIDVIFVARLGQAQLAASSLGVSLFALLTWGMSGLTGAVAPLIASELGRKPNAVREVRRSLRMALWLAVICGLFGMTVCAFGTQIMLATGQDPEIAGLAGGFISVLSFSIIPMVISNVLRIFVSTMGRAGFATAITALAIVVNALGNWVFVFGNLGAPRLGLNGSALSSIITSVVMAAAYVVAIQSDRRMRRYRVFGRFWRPEWSRLREIVKIGTPIAVTVIAEAGLFSSAAFLMGRIGAAELAAHTIALQIASFAFQVPFGISQAATIRVGYHFGASNPDGIARAGWVAIAVGAGFMAMSALVMLAAPRAIVSAYVDVEAPQNALMVAFAIQYLGIAAAFQLFDGIQTVTAGALRGLQDTRTPMFIALAGYWLAGFSTASVLGLATPLEGVGVWIGLAVGLVFAAAFLLLRWRRRDAKGLVPARI
ncbi:MAG: MATE family efflux transporter [Novosphingobium sp.]|nr:MATE family efflux transporter [Novosphingobium sp.]